MARIKEGSAWMPAMGGAFEFRLLACSAEELKTSFFQGMSKFYGGGIIESEAIVTVNQSRLGITVTAPKKLQPITSQAVLVPCPCDGPTFRTGPKTGTTALVVRGLSGIGGQAHNERSTHKAPRVNQAPPPSSSSVPLSRLSRLSSGLAK